MIGMSAARLDRPNTGFHPPAAARSSWVLARVSEMSAAKTIGLALDEDFVWSIADELRPWRHSESSESHVFVEIRNTIEGMRSELAKAPEIGFRNENKQRAKRIVDALNIVERATASPTFIASLLISSEEFKSEELALMDKGESELEDLEMLWIKKRRNLRKKWPSFPSERQS
jgi:hypothetical protein